MQHDFKFTFDANQILHACKEFAMRELQSHDISGVFVVTTKYLVSDTDALTIEVTAKEAD